MDFLFEFDPRDSLVTIQNKRDLGLEGTKPVQSVNPGMEFQDRHRNHTSQRNFILFGMKDC